MIELGELFKKKSLCHALISSSNSPDVFIPVKAIIEDVHFHETSPHYSLRIIKLYDTIFFLKEAFDGKRFVNGYKQKPVIFKYPKKIKTPAQLEQWLSNDYAHRFVVNGAFVVQRKFEMVELFNKIQEYLIAKNLRVLKTTLIRRLYEGPMKISSFVEFSNGIKRMFSDKLSNDQLDELLSHI